jgi:DNA polymerase zeta
VRVQRGILGRAMQPYEAHVPYLLQFFMDYNISGMNWLHASAAKVKQVCCS